MLPALDKNAKAVLITGVTGKQGGATINSLIDSGALATYKLLAVTRDTNSSAARELAARGVTLIQGDLSDCHALFHTAMILLASENRSRSIWGVFSVQALSKKEEEQGKALVDAAVANKVEFFVYTSVDRGGEDRSPQNPTNVPHFSSKHRIETYLLAAARKSHMNWTILRPVCFMENLSLGKGFEAKVMGTAWRIGLGSKPLQLVATSDIGWYAAQALLHPDIYSGRSISIAGDELSFAQANGLFKAQSGQDIPQTMPILARLIMWLAGDLGAMINWFSVEGYKADITSLRQEHPQLLSFEAWLIGSGWVKKAK
ncbi:NAD(P)-binding protein, partial [Aureobasidium melanogenum]